MKIPVAYRAVMFATLVALSRCAHADMDADSVRKLLALRSLALSAAPISPQQVSKELSLKLGKSCADVDQGTAGKFYICLYRPAKQDPHRLAFVQYKTINRSAGEDTGGGVEFVTRGENTCIRKEDLSKVFQIEPAPSGSPAFPEATLPYIPVGRYQFIFPKQGDSDVHVEVFQTGECVTTVTLIKSSYNAKIGK